MRLTCIPNLKYEGRRLSPVVARAQTYIRTYTHTHTRAHIRTPARAGAQSACVCVCARIFVTGSWWVKVCWKVFVNRATQSSCSLISQKVERVWCCTSRLGAMQFRYLSSSTYLPAWPPVLAPSCQDEGGANAYAQTNSSTCSCVFAYIMAKRRPQTWPLATLHA